MTVGFRNPEKCETCGHCKKTEDLRSVETHDGDVVHVIDDSFYDCLVYGGRPLRVRPDGYCVMFVPKGEGR